jgi:hypothetical protein
MRWIGVVRRMSLLSVAEVVSLSAPLAGSSANSSDVNLDREFFLKRKKYI